MKLKKWNRPENCVGQFFRSHRAIFWIMLLLLLERLLVLAQLGITYTLESDDLSYVKSGIEFANSGAITMHGPISAQIMQGMPVWIGFFSLLFGEGTLLWVVLKLVWICMGVWTAFFLYRTILLFAPKWCGLVGACFLFAPNFAWMDNVILTETPFLLLLTALVYFTFMMGRSRQKKYFWYCLAAYMLALMLKANIGIYPLFAAIYLLVVKYDFKVLLKQGLILACALLCFMIPWSIRNYIQFQAFIPLTYGSGNPKLLGTYQGEGYPADETLDYETNVEQVAAERFAKYYDENGEVKKPQYLRYLSLEKDGIKADYRISQWLARDPKSFMKSYLVLKPLEMVQSVFYWKQVLFFPKSILLALRKVDLLLCTVSVLLSLALKKRRPEMLFLAAFYWCNIYIYAMTYSFDRYAESLSPVRFLIIGIGLCLIFDALWRACRSAAFYNRAQNSLKKQ